MHKHGYGYEEVGRQLEQQQAAQLCSLQRLHKLGPWRPASQLLQYHVTSIIGVACFRDDIS